MVRNLPADARRKAEIVGLAFAWLDGPRGYDRQIAQAIGFFDSDEQLEKLFRAFWGWHIADGLLFITDRRFVYFRAGPFPSRPRSLTYTQVKWAAFDTLRGSKLYVKLIKTNRRTARIALSPEDSNRAKEFVETLREKLGTRLTHHDPIGWHGPTAPKQKRDRRNAPKPTHLGDEYGLGPPIPTQISGDRSEDP